MLSDSTLTRDQLDEMLEPHDARIATCQPQTGCWGRYGEPAHASRAYDPMRVLVQLPPRAQACSVVARAMLEDSRFDDTLRTIDPVRPDANCTCYSIFELTAVNNRRIPGSPQLPPPKEKKPKRGQSTKEEKE